MKLKAAKNIREPGQIANRPRGRQLGEKLLLTHDQQDLVKKSFNEMQFNTVSKSPRPSVGQVWDAIKQLTGVEMSEKSARNYRERWFPSEVKLERGRPTKTLDKRFLNAILELLQLTHLSASGLFNQISKDTFFGPRIGKRANFLNWLQKENVRAKGRSQARKGLLDRCILNLHLTCFNRQPDDDKPTNILAILWAFEAATGFINCQLFTVDAETNVNRAAASDNECAPPKVFMTRDRCTLPLWAIRNMWVDTGDRLGLPITHVRLSRNIIADPDSQATLAAELTRVFNVANIEVTVTVEPSDSRFVDSIPWLSNAPLDKIRVAISNQVDAHNKSMLPKVQALKADIKALQKKSNKAQQKSLTQSVWLTPAARAKLSPEPAQLQEFYAAHPIKPMPKGKPQLRSVSCRKKSLSESFPEKFKSAESQ